MVEMPLPQDQHICGYDIIGEKFSSHRSNDIITLNKDNGKLPFRPYRVYSLNGKLPTICTSHQGYEIRIKDGGNTRKLTATECCRLQTIPEWYKWECSNTQIYKMLGNGWTVDVIKHIFSYLPTINEIAV